MIQLKSSLCPSIINRSRTFIILILMAASSGRAQVLATLRIELDHPAAGIEIPVHTMLDPITHLPDAELSLVEIQGKKRIPVSFQVDAAPQRKLTWLVSDKTKSHVYELSQQKSSRPASTNFQAIKKEGALTLKAGNKNLVRYHFESVYPPAGIDTVFKRSAFIHPLWSPHGQELTRIQAPDHYHHYGLWNPWTHVLFEGDTVDFWNLKSRQGTVRFSGFISVVTGDVFGEYAALHEHVAFKKGKPEHVAIQEVQTVRIYAPSDNDYYVMDIDVEMNCPGSEVRLLEYRYGGMGWRATDQWTKENSSVLSSEGRTRKDADGSKARWCIVEGTVDGENAGAVMMSYPVNYNHPEPLRIWPENANGNRGDMFANFSPTKDKDWLLEPGKKYTLRYRFIVFNGEFTGKKAEAAWRYFASPPSVSVEMNSKRK
jgi:hypothetical protein